MRAAALILFFSTGDKRLSKGWKWQTPTPRLIKPEQRQPAARANSTHGETVSGAGIHAHTNTHHTHARTHTHFNFISQRSSYTETKSQFNNFRGRTICHVWYREKKTSLFQTAMILMVHGFVSHTEILLGMFLLFSELWGGSCSFVLFEVQLPLPNLNLGILMWKDRNCSQISVAGIWKT